MLSNNRPYTEPATQNSADHLSFGGYRPLKSVEDAVFLTEHVFLGDEEESAQAFVDLLVGIAAAHFAPANDHGTPLLESLIQMACWRAWRDTTDYDEAFARYAGLSKLTSERSA